MSELRRALRKAIAVSPRTFGLSMEDVNPLLRLWNAGLEPTEETQLACFEACRQNVDAKIRELAETDAPKPATNGQGRQRKEQGKPADEPADGQGGDKPTGKQIRYYGHLCYELGQTPDYDTFKKKDGQHASILIRELEESLKKKKRVA